jgi:signal transduction histidine kinase
VRLFLQLYLSFVGIVVLMVATVGCLAVTFRDDHRTEEAAAWAELWLADLPDDPVQRDDRFARLGELIEHEVALYDADGQLVAGDPDVPAGPAGPYRDGPGHGFRVALSDGRVLGVRTRPDPRRHRRFLFLLTVMGVVVAVGCWPVARRLSRRLEQLRDSAERWGDGELDARVAVHGGDEVARVGRAFNQAADRVQALVVSQQRVLAHASHELRSPLARLRVALEMVPPGPLVDQAIGEVEVLDDIVGDVLRAARMEGLSGPESPEEVSLREVLEGFAADDVVVEGPDRVVQGDPRLLRRLVRNLVENARRYGEPPIVLTVTDDGLWVDDRGDALPEAERSAIFEPFHRREGHAEGVHGGVGLGLSLVRQIARFHGGDVRYVEVDGRSRFVVELP